jgi:hypothetical protein
MLRRVEDETDEDIDDDAHLEPEMRGLRLGMLPIVMAIRSSIMDHIIRSEKPQT